MTKSQKQHRNELYEKTLYEGFLLHAQIADNFAAMLETKPAWIHAWITENVREHTDRAVRCLEQL